MNKRIFTLLTAAMISCTVPMTVFAEAPDPSVLYDVNLDGYLTAADCAMLLQKVLNNGYKLPIEKAADNSPTAEIELLSAITPYLTERVTLPSADSEMVTIAGKHYSGAIIMKPRATLSGGTANAYFSLEGNYKSLTFTIGHIDGSNNEDAYVTVYVDDAETVTKEMKYSDLPETITVPLNGAKKLQITVGGEWYSNSNYKPWYGIVNASVAEYIE